MVSDTCTGMELKGNPVKIGNSPAAVSSANENGNHSYATDMTIGKAPLTGVSQKTCHANYKNIGFRGLKLEDRYLPRNASVP